MWVYQWGLACCAIEMGAAFGSPRYDVMRLGVIPLPASPRQADLVVISGTVTDKMAPAIKPPLRADARPEVRDLDGLLRQLRRPVLGQLLGHEGRRPDHPGRHLRPRLPAPARGAARGRSCCCRSASRTRTWPSAGRRDPHVVNGDRREETEGRRARKASSRPEPRTVWTPSATTRSPPCSTSSGTARRRRSSTRCSSRATTCGCASAPTPGWRPARPLKAARLRLLLLPVGHRLDAVAVRQGRGRPDRAAAGAARRRSGPGYAGGDTRFQVLARLSSSARHRRRDPEGRRARRRPGEPGDALLGRRLRRRQLARARDVGDVRHPLRRPSRPAPPLPADASSRASRCARTSRCSPGW